MIDYAIDAAFRLPCCRLLLRYAIDARLSPYTLVDCHAISHFHYYAAIDATPASAIAAATLPVHVVALLTFYLMPPPLRRISLRFAFYAAAISLILRHYFDTMPLSPACLSSRCFRAFLMPLSPPPPPAPLFSPIFFIRISLHY